MATKSKKETTKPAPNLVRTFWKVFPANKKKVEKLAKEQGVSESQIIRTLIGR